MLAAVGIQKHRYSGTPSPFVCVHVHQDLKKVRGWQLDARLLAYAWGLQDSQDWNLGRVRQAYSSNVVCAKITMCHTMLTRIYVLVAVQADIALGKQ